MSKVSVIIPCYNQGTYLREAVDSVLHQTFQDFDIVIVNDGSTDHDTNQILNTLQHPKITVIRTENTGPSAARNCAIAASEGEYILPLDADDKIGCRYLEKAAALLDRGSSLGIVYCKAEFFGARSGPWDLPAYAFPAILSTNCIFCCALFRKSDWELVGGYKTNMKYGHEDWDFWLSLIERGRTVYQIDEVLFFYRQYDSAVSVNHLLHKNDKRVMCTHRQVIKNHIDLYVQYPQALFALIPIPGVSAKYVRRWKNRFILISFLFFVYVLLTLFVACVWAKGTVGK